MLNIRLKSTYLLSQLLFITEPKLVQPMTQWLHIKLGQSPAWFDKYTHNRNKMPVLH